MSSPVLSLYIPVIQEKTSEEYIKSIFIKKNIGKILRVDFVVNMKKNRREAFIHFDEWYDNEECKKLKDDIMDPNTKTKLYHTNERFWPILVNKNPHKRIINPDYKILSNHEVKIVCANSLNLIKLEKMVANSTTKRIKA
tara:strand:- start:304 stop:723 length:420 start_codon:yes stop_codon:yes gene_type:complete